MKEIWKNIEGYENKYQVSNTGKVRSMNYNNSNKIKELKPKINKQGNLEVTLSKNDKCYYYMVNRLVIHTFTDKKLSKNDIVMYKNNDKTNCSLDNMYLITRGKRQELTYSLEKRFRHKYEYYGEMLTTKELAKRVGISPEQVRNRIEKLKWSSYECEIPLIKYKSGVKKYEK